MQDASSPPRDPIVWCAFIALAFLALALHRLGIPSRFYFDEIHYVPAARKLLDMVRANPEHPMVGKEIIAASIAVLGDKPLSWRIPSLLFGALGLFAFGRVLWWLSLRRFATVASMLLLATNFSWFIHSRIAMLDMVMAGFAMVALWQFAAALHLPPKRARWRLALAGICLGLALGAKWNIAPAAMLPGLAFLAAKVRDTGPRFVHAREGGLVPGITLAEGALWLGVLPLLVYWASYAPAFLYAQKAVDPLGFIQHHQYMFELQESVRKPHPYRSVWYQWMINWRAIWYLYEEVDGALRGIVLIGNPFSMLAGLPALAWCAWAAVSQRRRDAAAFALLYAFSIGLWIVSTKPIQFYYHYLLPGTFLMGCLALLLDDLWQRAGRWRWAGPAALALATGMFVWFYPIISAAELHGGKRSFEFWMWLPSWR